MPFAQSKRFQWRLNAYASDSSCRSKLERPWVAIRVKETLEHRGPLSNARECVSESSPADVFVRRSMPMSRSRRRLFHCVNRDPHPVGGGSALLTKPPRLITRSISVA